MQSLYDQLVPEAMAINKGIAKDLFERAIIKIKNELQDNITKTSFVILAGNSAEIRNEVCKLFIEKGCTIIEKLDYYQIRVDISTTEGKDKTI